MLKPRDIERLPDSIIGLYSQVEQDILADMARRISTYDYWIPSVEYQYQKLIEMGNFHSFTTEALSARTGASTKEIEQLMQEAASKSLAFDTNIYKEQGLSPPPLAASTSLRKTLNAGLKRTNNTFKNLTSTTANTATKQLEDALDRAWLQVGSGAFDRNAAVRMAIKDLSKQGVGAIKYPSGHVDNLEVVVTRAVRTGVNQTCLQLQEVRADEMGCDLVETTAHGGARPDHAAWQGQVFSRSGKHPKYKEFKSATGYGTGAGLGGWNCRHSFFPYFEGSPRAYNKKQLDEYDAENYEYNGKKMTEYEATQKQRSIERQIRRWKREEVAMKAAGEDAAESAAQIARWQSVQKDFLRQTDLKRKIDREQIGGFGKSQAQRVAQQNKMPEAVVKFNQTHLAKNESEKLLNYKEAVIPDEKITAYALNKEHPTGKHKAIVFESALGYNISNKDELVSQLHEGIGKYRTSARPETKYGKPFEVEMMVKGANGKYARVKSGWIFDHGSDKPRLTSVYVKE